MVDVGTGEGHGGHVPPQFHRFLRNTASWQLTELPFLAYEGAPVFVVVVAYFSLSRLLYLAFSANLDLLSMPNPGMGPLV